MRLIDLSRTLEPGMEGVEFRPTKFLEKDGWNAQHITLYSHVGTHVDAPCHSFEEERGLDSMELQEFVAHCWVVDCRRFPPKELLTPSHLSEVADKIKPGEGIVLHSGWSKKFGHSAYRDELHRVSLELVEFLADKQVRMIGVEAPSIADVNNIPEVLSVHRALFKANITILEGLCNLDQIGQDRVLIMALPLRIKGGDGSPTRAVAVLEE